MFTPSPNPGTVYASVYFCGTPRADTGKGYAGTREIAARVADILRKVGVLDAKRSGSKGYTFAGLFTDALYEFDVTDLAIGANLIKPAFAALGMLSRCEIATLPADHWKHYTQPARPALLFRGAAVQAMPFLGVVSWRGFSDELLRRGSKEYDDARQRVKEANAKWIAAVKQIK